MTEYPGQPNGSTTVCGEPGFGSGGSGGGLEAKGESGEEDTKGVDQ